MHSQPVFYWTFGSAKNEKVCFSGEWVLRLYVHIAVCYTVSPVQGNFPGLSHIGSQEDALIKTSPHSRGGGGGSLWCSD